MKKLNENELELCVIGFLGGDFLNCVLCLGVLQDPKQCRNGHNFCNSCILSALKSKKECPCCKVEMPSGSQLVTNLLAKNLTAALRYRCRTSQLRTQCSWIGASLKDRQDHITVCPFEVIKYCAYFHQSVPPCCGWKQCVGIVKRMDEKNHHSKPQVTDVIDLTDLPQSSVLSPTIPEAAGRASSSSSSRCNSSRIDLPPAVTYLGSNRKRGKP